MENSNDTRSFLDQNADGHQDRPSVPGKGYDNSKQTQHQLQKNFTQSSIIDDYRIMSGENTLDHQPIRLNSVSSTYSSYAISPKFSFTQLAGNNNANTPTNNSNLPATATTSTNNLSNNGIIQRSKGFSFQQSDSASSSRRSSYSNIRPDYSIRSATASFSGINGGIGHGHAATVHSLLGIHHSSSSLSVNEIAVCQTDSEDDDSADDDEYFRKSALQNRMLLNSEYASLNRHNSFTSAPPSNLKTVVHANNLSATSIPNSSTSVKFFHGSEIGSAPTSPRTNFPDIAHTPQSQINNSFYSSSRLSSPSLASPGATSTSEYNRSPGIHFKSNSRSKKNLMPRLKSFSRIASELQNEISPFDSEIRHEFHVTSALKDEDEILESPLASSRLADLSANRTYKNDMKKFEMINKINEAWSQNKFESDSKNKIAGISGTRSASIDNITNALSNNDELNQTIDDDNSLFSKPNTNSTITQQSSSSSSSSSSILPSTPLPIARRKRKSISGDERYIPSTKKRIVSIPSPVLSSAASSPSSITSPNLSGIFPPSRRNSNKLMQRASDDLESMSLR